MNLKFWKKEDKQEVIATSLELHILRMQMLQNQLADETLTDDERQRLTELFKEQEAAVAEILRTSVRKTLKIIVGIGLVVIVVGAASYFITSKDDEDESEETGEDAPIVYLSDEALEIENNPE